VTFSPPQGSWTIFSRSSNILDATLVIAFDLPTASGSFNVQLALTDDIYFGVEPESDIAASDEEEEEGLVIDEPESDGSASIDIGGDGNNDDVDSVPGTDVPPTPSPESDHSVNNDDDVHNMFSNDGEDDDSSSAFDHTDQNNIIIDGNDLDNEGESTGDSVIDVPESTTEGRSSQATGPTLLLRDVVVVTGWCLLLGTILCQPIFL
jgi:hypothetical protein